MSLSSTEARLLVALARIGVVMKADQWRSAHPSGLTPTQSQALAVLRARGPLRPGEIAEGLAVRAPTATDVVAVLATKGLVARRPDPADGRAFLVDLTPEGAERAGAANAWSDAMLEVVGALEPAEQAVMLRALSKMIVQLQALGRIDVARVCLTCRHFRPNAHPRAPAPHHCAFVDRPFGDHALQVDCPDHQPEASP